MKGILLAAGRGSRLYPTTLSTCKQLLPIYDKPLIYYPLCVLMMAGIHEVLLIANAEDIPRFQALFGDGSHLGIQIAYAEQKRPEGIAQAFVIGEEFIGKDSVCLILGDNIFYGQDLAAMLKPSQEGATIFGYEVKDPERYGVISFDEAMRPQAIIEKPKVPPSRYAVTGLYFYDNEVLSIARALKPSQRGEYEITDVNSAYLAKGKLSVRLLGRGFAWLDTGTFSSLLEASCYVETLQKRQGIQIGSVEEVAYQMGYIDAEQLEKLAHRLASSEYGQYLLNLSKNEPSYVF